MAGVYCAKCLSCGYESPHATDGSAGIIVDEPVKSVGTHRENNRIVVLMHPLEGSILQETGYTMRSASREGRLLHIEKVFCRSCGRLYETRKLVARIGCVLSAVLVLAAVAGGATVWYLTSRVDAGFAVLCLALLTLAFIGTLCEAVAASMVRRRFPERRAAYELKPCCPDCGSTKYRSLKAFIPRRLPCPKCRQRTMKVEMVGIS